MITAESYEDAETRIQREVEGYMASLNVANAVKREIDRSMQWSEAAVPTPQEGTQHEARRDTATLQRPGMRYNDQPFFSRG